ncbi:unnamed protein product [Rotaria sp. Silwood2]|nr:unnamed protein product [Rotaria sp. Silwood2]CAF4537647.1 unnamed protein product [Rotaria sp. Silwood2]
MALNEIARNDIHLQNQLGNGAFGVVYKAIWLSRNFTVACKCIDIDSNVNPNIRSKILMIVNEIAGYIVCYGPFVLTVYGWSHEILSSGHLCLLIIMEYMPKGSLTNGVTTRI